jgi:DNA helicase-2/ATP-dependent DNA helicase PcrA
VPEAIRAWRAYKGEHGLVGFADMLERVAQRSLVPNVDYLAVDEFQDITLLQHRVYEEWKPHVKRALIAGDDDQVVYAWQGADPQLLLEEEGEDVILDTSHRLPSRVLDVVNREVRHIAQRQEKNLEPRTEGGTVEAIRNATMLALVRQVRSTVERGEETVMVLFRARYQLFQFVEKFVDEGIPFQALTDQRLWTDRLADYVRAIEALEAGEAITGLEARRLADMLEGTAFGTNDRDALYDALDARLEEAATEDFEALAVEPDLIEEHVPFLPGPGTADDMLRKVSGFQEQSVAAYFAGEHRGMARDRVRVGTIHSAKGREADHVFVATDLTEKVVEQMVASVPDPEAVAGVDEFTKTSDPVPVLTDNERRVFYVGMSRARERLVLLENLVRGAPTLPIDVLLNNELTGATIEELLGDAEEPAAAD